MIALALRGARPRTTAGVSLAAAALLATCLLSSAAASTPEASQKPAAANELNIVADPTGPFTNGFNPFSSSNSAYVQGATGMIYEPLVQYNLARSGQIYPWLATSWAWAAGGDELVVRTRTGVKWSDGVPFTAADVAYTFNLLNRFPALDANGLELVSATAASPTEAILKFASPAYTQLFDISQVLVVPQHIWRGISTPVDYSDDQPVGTGPYLVGSFSSLELTLVRNPHYWQPGLPRIGTLNFLSYGSDPLAGIAIRSGTIDWNSVFMPNYRAGFVNRDPGHHFEAAYPVGNFFLCPNLTKYPFNQLVVRQALSESIDRNAIVSQGEHGLYFADTSPTGLTLSRWRRWLAPQFAKLTEVFNPAGAKRLLEAHGFEPGNDGMLREPDGNPLAMTLLVPAAYTDWMADGQLIVNETRRAGIALSLSAVPVSNWVQDEAIGNYQLTFCGQFTTDGPYSMYDYLLNSSLSAPIGRRASGDPERLVSISSDRALSTAASTQDLAQIQAAYTTLETLMVGDIPAVPLFNGGAWAGYSTTHAVGWPSASNPYEMNDLESPWDEVVVLRLRPA
jgi:peptide/nickel transport system substrate-binding protein